MIRQMSVAMTAAYFFAGTVVSNEPAKELLTLQIFDSIKGRPGKLPNGADIGTEAWIREYRVKNSDPVDGAGPVIGYYYLYHEFYKGKGPIKGAARTIWPPIYQKDILPAMGYLYRSNTPAGGELKWVPDKDLPAGLTPPDRSSLFLPLQRHGLGYLSFGIGGAHLRCTKITPGKGGKAGDSGPTAELDFGYFRPKTMTKSATVRAGDIVVLPDTWGGFVVRRIIAPNEKDRIIGWVELSAAGMSEEEIKKATNPIIRLEVAEK